MPMDMCPSIFVSVTDNFFGHLFVKHLKFYYLHNDLSDLPCAPNLIIALDSDIRRGNSPKDFATDGDKI
jgi:hypothetical protein